MRFGKGKERSTLDKKPVRSVTQPHLENFDRERPTIAKKNYKKKYRKKNSKEKEAERLGVRQREMLKGGCIQKSPTAEGN